MHRTNITSSRLPQPALRAASRTAAIALILAAVAQAQIHVDDNAAPGGNGATWASAYDRLELALAVAPPGSTIWLAEGVYRPGTTQTASFILPSNVTVIGGWLGTELIGPPLGSNANTILSGDIDFNPANTAADSFHVVQIPPGSTGIRLVGVRIQYGNAQPSASGLGGGIEIQGSLGNPVFDVLIDNCIVENCRARDGGGLGARAIVRLGCKRTVFRDNIARNNGGGVYLQYGGTGDYCAGDGVKFFNTEFANNRATAGGGLWNALNDAQMWTVNSKFTDNSASRGGAIYSGDALSLSYPLHIVNCTVAYNRAYDINGTGSQGAGIYLADQISAVFVDNTIVWGNSASVGTLFRAGSSIEGPGASPQTGGTLSVRYSDVEIVPLSIPLQAWPGPGNLNLSPVFVNATTRDLRLAAFSPCIDAGDDFLVPFDFLDLDGDGDFLEQVPRELIITTMREIDDPGVADTGINDANTNSYAEIFCGLVGSTTPPILDSGIVDMGCHERRNISQ